jgi:hypothetical protein
MQLELPSPREHSQNHNIRESTIDGVLRVRKSIEDMGLRERKRLGLGLNFNPTNPVRARSRTRARTLSVSLSARATGFFMKDVSALT